MADDLSGADCTHRQAILQAAALCDPGKNARREKIPRAGGIDHAFDFFSTNACML